MVDFIAVSLSVSELWNAIEIPFPGTPCLCSWQVQASIKKLYSSGFICSDLTLIPIKVASLWCQWDSIQPVLRCLWPLYLSTPHTCNGGREKQGHAEKWGSSKNHWGQGEWCAQCFSTSGSPVWNTCVPAGLDCPWAGVASASYGQDWGENLITECLHGCARVLELTWK